MNIILHGVYSPTLRELHRNYYIIQGLPFFIVCVLSLTDIIRLPLADAQTVLGALPRPFGNAR